MHPSPGQLLPAVIEAVTRAGDMLAAEFTRPDGPRFADNVTAPIDREIELFLRERLRSELPARFVGEEAGVLEAKGTPYCWIVDPQDGTRAFLEGRRGSAVSVALLRRGIPVLGVVYAPLSPDRGRDLIAWAENLSITRNGKPVDSDLRQRRLASRDVVFLNHGAWQRPVWNSLATAPARFMPLPSIAYRLARVAVGDGVAAVTLRPVHALDIAAGHALLLAAGGVVVAEDGTPVSYNPEGESRPSACFGGAPHAVSELLTRTWRGSVEARREPRVCLNWPRAADERALDRAIGCLLGQVIGDSLGGQVEFKSAREIAIDWPEGVCDLRDGGVWGTIAGQPTDDSELMLALARSLAGHAEYDPERAAGSYARWFESRPFDCGNTLRRALTGTRGKPAGIAETMRENASRTSQANGSLMRMAPVGIWAGSASAAAMTAMADSALTHPHPACTIACAAYCAAIAAGIQGASRTEMLQVALKVAQTRGPEAEPVPEVLRQAADGKPPASLETNIGWVVLALHNAFYHLAVGTPVEEALILTVGAGGDTDTNAAIAGALLGAAEGRSAFPSRWIREVLTCRPDPGLQVTHPRPDEYWPDDLPDLAEALLLSRPHRR